MLIIYIKLYDIKIFYNNIKMFQTIGEQTSSPHVSQPRDSPSRRGSLSRGKSTLNFLTVRGVYLGFISIRV